MISGLHLRFTYRCTRECDHCFLYSSPKAKEMQAGVLEKIAAVSGAGLGEFKERIAELNEIIPLIGEPGDDADGLEIGLGLIPDVGMQISGLTKTMPEEPYNRVLQEQQEKIREATCRF